MELLIPIVVIGLTGLLFGRITVYPVDRLKPHPVWRVAVSLALTCLHAYLWSLLAIHLSNYGNQGASPQNREPSLYDFWKIPLMGSLSVLVVHLDERADRPFFPKFLKNRQPRRK